MKLSKTKLDLLNYFKLNATFKNWAIFFNQELKKSYFFLFLKKIKKEYQNNNCSPKKELIFLIFSLIKPTKIKLIIIGQDPYLNNNVANGIAFDVLNQNKLPASLKNLTKEYNKSFNSNFLKIPFLDLIKQNVFFYNIVLSNNGSKILSHQNIGYLIFTNNLLKYLAKINKNILIVSFGKKFKNLILKSGFKNYFCFFHPSPQSYHLLKKQNPFLKIEQFLQKEKQNIYWIKKN